MLAQLEQYANDFDLLSYLFIFPCDCFHAEFVAIRCGYVE